MSTPSTIREFEHLGSEEIWNLFYFAPVAMAKIDSTHKILDCNEEWCKLTEYSRSEMQRMTWIDITPAREEQNRDAENIRSVVRGEVPYFDMLKTIRSKSGNDIRVWLRAVGNHNPEGEFLYFWSHYKPHVELDHTVFTRNPKTGKDMPDLLKIFISYAQAHPTVAVIVLAFFMGGPAAVREILILLFPEFIH